MMIYEVGNFKQGANKSFLIYGGYYGVVSRRLESRMTSSPVTRLNIPVTRSLKWWLGKTGISESLSQVPGLVSNAFTKIDK